MNAALEMAVSLMSCSRIVLPAISLVEFCILKSLTEAGVSVQARVYVLKEQTDKQTVTKRGWGGSIQLKKQRELIAFDWRHTCLRPDTETET